MFIAHLGSLLFPFFVAYYYNASTGVTSWEKPLAPGSAPAAPAAPSKPVAAAPVEAADDGGFSNYTLFIYDHFIIYLCIYVFMDITATS